MKKIIACFCAFLGLFAHTISVSAADIHVGLVSYWPLDVDSGGFTPDVSFTNHLNIFGGATTTAGGQVSNAFVFNGSSQYLSVTHSISNSDSGLPIWGAGNYTIALWVNGAQNQADKYIFTHGNTTNANPFFSIQTKTGASTTFSNKLDIFLRTTGGTILLNHVKSVSPVLDGTWHHIAWVDERGSAKLYVDGNLDSSYVYTYTVGNPALNTTSIGALVRTTTAGFFVGAVDDVATWERALTQAEIQAVKTNSIPTPVPLLPPTVSISPLNPTLSVGDHARFVLAAPYGVRPFTYQWKRDGVIVPDATNQTYTLFHVTTNDSGAIFTAEVTNPGGTTATNSVLTVLADPAINVVNGLLNYWPFENVTNASLTTPDLYSQNDMLLKTTNSSTTFDANNIVPGQFGNALAFDGLGQYSTRVGGLPIYNNTNYSVSLWVKGNGTNGIGGQTGSAARVFSEASTNSNTPLFSIATDTAGTTGVASMFVRNDANSPLVNGRRSTRVVFDDAWHHIVWVDSNGQGKLYVDGVQDETDFSYVRGALTLNTTTAAGILRGNPFAPVNFFAGAIDEIALWNRALSISEIGSIRTNGVPAPVAAIPPSIITQPVSKTNGIFVGDNVSFSVQASGTSPLSYQWNKNGSSISSAINSTATNSILVLNNVQASEAGNYFVTITNVAGSTNSTTVQLTVISYTPATNGTVLALDFDLGTTTNVQPGFSRMTIGSNPFNFGSVGVTVSTIGSTTFSDRLRTTPVNNPPDFTQAQIYNDFIYSTSATDGTGAKILIERLAPNTAFGLTVWSWDRDNFGARVSDWIETASGSTNPIITGYSWDGTLPPTKDYMDTFGALLTSSSTGKLQIEGRKNGGAGISVFVNALRLVANPSIIIAAAEIINGNLRLTIETQFPGQVVSITEQTDLGSGVWSTPTSGGIVETRGPIVIAEYPTSANQTFYRVTSP